VIPPNGRVIGVDLGSRRIGVAVTDTDQRIATGVATLHRSGDPAADRQALEKLMAEYGAVGVVVGLPVSLSGRPGPAAEAVLDEVAEIQASVGIEIVTEDERLTTRAAEGGLRAIGTPRRRRRNVIDQSAAAVLLQTWIERRSIPSRPSE
jgi:putative Holliday junction resolvase